MRYLASVWTASSPHLQSKPDSPRQADAANTDVALRKPTWALLSDAVSSKFSFDKTISCFPCDDMISHPNYVYMVRLL